MKSKEDIISILSSHQAQIWKQWPISSLALFGSVARDQATAESDIDLLVEFSSKVGWGVVLLEEHLGELLDAKVNIVSRGSLQPRHWQAIAPDLIEVLPNG